MRHLRLFLLALATLVNGLLFAQDSQKDLEQLMRCRGEYFFTLNVETASDIQALTRLCSVDKTDGITVVCYADQSQYEDLLGRGFQPVLQTPPSMLEEAVMWDGSDRAGYDWNSYPTYEAYEAMMFQFAADHPDRCEIISLGTLPSGHKILIAHLNNGSDYGKPKFLYTSTIHGDETTGWIMMLRLIDYLLENPDAPEVQNVMERLDLFIGPLSNPDGTYYGGNHTVGGARRNNANNRDLNRNFPDPHGSPHPDGYPYQTETEWAMQFAEDYPFTMAANFHGGSEVINYPWDNTYTLHADDDWYRLIAREYADLCHEIDSTYMDGFDNGITNGAVWYMIAGGRQDYMNGYHECREVTIECSNAYTPPASQLPLFWSYNKNALFAYMNQCLYGIHGTVTDSVTGQPLKATVTIAGHDDQFSSVSSHLPAGDYHRPIKGGTYNLTYNCEGYFSKTITVSVNDHETVVQDITLLPIDWSLPESQSTFMVYPNPNEGSFVVNAEGEFSYTIFNSLGQQILSGKSNGNTPIVCPDLKRGVYFLHLKSENGSKVEKLFIEK